MPQTCLRGAYAQFNDVTGTSYICRIEITDVDNRIVNKRPSQYVCYVKNGIFLLLRHTH